MTICARSLPPKIPCSLPTRVSLPHASFMGSWAAHSSPGALRDEVLEFCNAGSPPIVFTFGTGMMHADAVFRAAVDAVCRIDRRAILLTKFREQLPADLPAGIRHFAFVPLQSLLPFAGAI